MAMQVAFNLTGWKGLTPDVEGSDVRTDLEGGSIFAARGGT